MTKPSSPCPDCGAPLVGGGPCPACLMRLGMAPGNAGDDPRFETQDLPERIDSHDDAALAQLQEALPQFEILSVIGQGGMGTVYNARQKSLDRGIALKVIKPEVASSQGFADRFSREAKALAKLSHQNIVTIHDFGQFGEQYYFVMEHVDGVNLREAMVAGEMQPADALTIVPQICDALQYAHEEGVVHRDIKPENILIDRRGRVKIADFGLAKLLNPSVHQHTLTQSHQVMGTMHYMAPEQLNRPTEVDHRADIYSLGVVLYEMMTGALPIGRFPLPSEQELDARLDELVLRTLSREPDQRFQQASELRTAVESLSSERQGAPGDLRSPIDHSNVPPVLHPPVKPASETPNQWPTERPHELENVDGAETTGEWIMNPGMFLGDLIVACTGVALGIMGVLFGETVFIWVGLGLAIYGGNSLGNAWSEPNRVRPSAQADLTSLISGATMLVIGVLLLGFSMTGHLDHVMTWVGLGLILGASGCVAAAWNESTYESLNETDHKPDKRPATAGIATALFVLSILQFVIAGLTSIALAVLLAMAGKGASPTFAVLIICGLGIVGSGVLGGLMMVGSHHLANRHSYGMSLIGSIAAVSPLSLLWPVTLPFGIWALAVITRPQVRELFEAD